MHAEKVSEIIAHFIGLFDAHTEEMRLRQQALDGQAQQESHADVRDDAAPPDDFSSDLTLIDFDPGVKYVPNAYAYDHLQARLYDETFHASLKKLADLAQAELPHRIDLPDSYVPAVAAPEKLHVDPGQGSEIGHLLQANVVRDDDILDMTDGHHPVLNLPLVLEELADMSVRAEALSPFSTLERTDSPDALTKIADGMRDFARDVEENGGTNIRNADGSHYMVTAGPDLDGVHINGSPADALPSIGDFMPDRGLATPSEEPVGSDGPLHSTGFAGNSLDVEAGANVSTNVATVVDTGIIAPVMAVMGDYHSIDSISQVYACADNDTIKGLLAEDASSSNSAQTIGKNIAMFEHSQFANDPTQQASESGGDPMFPTAWHVSVVDGDVSFVHWIEQYNFVSDNDSLTVTTSGVDTTVLSGGNSAVDLASYLGIGLQYDLVIVGGHVLDMNSITQVSVLYDNDTVKFDANASGAQVETGGNLLWNLAAIQNVGEADRFAAMPDYMNDVVKNIEDRDASMPEGLSHDPNFAGYAGLNVLYITGNFYDVNVVKQVNIVGDADLVNKVASSVSQDNQDAAIKIDTGNNAVVNIADIVDYDSFGHTTYVAGNVYSDAILIQGGLVDHDRQDPTQPTDKLANEAIAFLDDHDPQAGQDATIDLGHDLSWQNGSLGDPMHSLTA